jgi:hypothetical protein
VLGPFYGAMDITVNCTSARAWAKGVTAGIPDLVLQWPLVGCTFYHETKIDARQTTEQRDFELGAAMSGTPYILGDITSAFDFVEWLDIGWRVGAGDTVQFYPRWQWPDRIGVRHGINVDGLRWAKIARTWLVSEPNRAHHERWGFRE